MTDKKTITPFKQFSRMHLSLPRHKIEKDVDKDKGKEMPDEHAREARTGLESAPFAFKAQIIRKISDED